MASTLAVFKPTNAGIYNDLVRIKKSELLAWGGFRSRLQKLYKEAAGTEFIDGVEVYKNINLKGNICTETSPQYKMLKLMGFKNEDLEELCKVEEDNNLDEFKITWNGIEHFEKDSWDILIENFAKQVKTFDRIELLSSPVKYNTRTYTEEQALPIYSNQFNVTHETEEQTRNLTWQQDDDWIKEGGELGEIITKETANTKKLMNFFSVKLYKNNTEITENYSIAFKQAIVSLLLLEDENIFTNISRTNENVIVDNFIVKKQTEIFTNNFNKVYMKGRYEQYTMENPDEESDELRIAGIEENDGGGNITFKYTPRYWSFIWATQNDLGAEDAFEESEGLFKKVGGQIGLDGEIIGGENRMTVEGLKKCKPDIFGYYVSKFMKVYTKLDKGGFLKRFFMGLIRAFGSLIEAALGLIEKIPILGDGLKLIYKLISKVFGISYEDAKNIIGKVVTTIVAIIITIYIGGSDGGAMIQAATSGLGVSTGVLAGLAISAEWGSRILSIYNAIKQAQIENINKNEEKERKKEEKRKAEMKYENPIHKAMAGTMGTYEEHSQINEIMYNTMFNPFDSFNQAIPAEEYKITR